MACIDQYQGRYEALFSDIRRDLDELRLHGFMEVAREVSDATGQYFNSRRVPLYFTGDLDSEVVLVQLNPKQADERTTAGFATTENPTFEEYWESARHFGEHNYGPTSPRTHRSPLDHKQVRFLRALGALPFVDEHTTEDRFTNLALAIDGKLQMEFIPYGSPDFSSAWFSTETLTPHFERLMTVIEARPRRLILFCGKAFEPLVQRFVTAEHTFHLEKVDGTRERMRSHFAMLEIPRGGRSITAGLASSWARQGIPMRAYGEMVRRLYAA